MRLFVSACLLSGLLMAGGANATSVTWTIPTTALTGSATYTSVSGTFAWDAVNQVVSNVNVTLVVGGTPTLITSSSVNLAPFIVLNNTPPSTGQPVFVINYTSLTNTATPTVVSYIEGGPCSVTGGQCVGYSGGPSSANNVTLTPYTPPAPTAKAIPTLSEWTQLLLALMTIMLVGWHFDRERSY